ncbi:2-isopropylmalate synthase [Campylobacter sp. MIT 12-8780]|uniref:2-isopropylmalate synthase n=1 Tax=Campylobacter sp. MIT 12-8780 TaxID=2202200 RepID=UPI00115E7F19|nr:2-isopropylmalate synthase [Campylobacter sp. MIT 12-8780]TQR41193.1 2-isopropylmalate synthase [Campylobacter sp. MIT 12-8780]
MSFKHYQRNYFMPPSPSYEWCKKEFITKAPIWCSVDLRDGNQALITPMSIEEKLEFFKLLVEIGFKQIEVGFPAASSLEFDFVRTLIEQDFIPDDVSIQILTQAREHIIKKSFEALKGCKNAIVHFYNSTSYAQRQQVFKKSKDEIKKIALEGAKLIKELARDTKGNFCFEYSPESFTGTEIDYALEVCDAIIDEFKPSKEKKLIINLPATVELSLPHVYASQIEYLSKRFKQREEVIISLHPHNDRGCATAAAELGLLAGADRVEGTLFGNGERTGNVDIITLAMNLYTHGVDPGLDFSDLPRICELYERVSKMRVYERQPYSGKLVFAAFSGSHQDAIAKGMAYHEEQRLETWSVPYLPLNPKHVGRVYESDVIRINSQSGKGGIAYILNSRFGANLPSHLREEFSYYIKEKSVQMQKELSADEIVAIFESDFVNVKVPLELLSFSFEKTENLKVNLKVKFQGKTHELKGLGNGRLDAVAKALKSILDFDFDVLDYSEHALSQGSGSKAIAYVLIQSEQKNFFGAGIDTDIITASILALITAINRTITKDKK